ncbi:MAG: hypothetical protein QME77_06430 [bacterium]|nr:hypothetical protein [bacterium]
MAIPRASELGAGASPAARTPLLITPKPRPERIVRVGAAGDSAEIGSLERRPSGEVDAGRNQGGTTGASRP